MKLISLNIQFDRHTDAVLAFLKKENPDVICLQELLEQDVALYKKALEIEGIYIPQHYMYHPGVGGLQDRRYGSAILTKHAVEKSGYSFYVGSLEDISKPFEEYFSERRPDHENRVLLWMDIIEGGHSYRVASTHFMKARGGQTTPYVEGPSTQEQLEALDILFGKLDSLGEFTLCGDMNAPRGNEAFARLAKRYKDNIPPEYKTSLDQNLHRVPGLELMVDGLFTTPLYEATGVTLVDGLSDHMAIVAHIEKQDIK